MIPIAMMQVQRSPQATQLQFSKAPDSQLDRRCISYTVLAQIITELIRFQPVWLDSRELLLEGILVVRDDGGRYRSGRLW